MTNPSCINTALNGFHKPPPPVQTRVLGMVFQLLKKQLYFVSVDLARKRGSPSPSVMQFDILVINTSRLSVFSLVDERFTKGLQHFSLVVIKVSIDMVDRLVLHHPQLALGLSDQPGIVAHNYHS